MIKLKNVSKFYYSKGVIASGFSKLNLEFKLGEFIAITGESGSGKSTLLNVISGLDSYEEGEMYVNNEETSHYISKDWEEYRRKYIANIYQNFNLINSYTVYQNIELVLTLNGVNKKESKPRVLELIKKVNLYPFRNTKVSKLSGGQKQRVAIARALAKDTPIIIADEPTGSLDRKSADEIIKLLSDIAKDKLVIIVTHNYEQIEKYVTRKITMHDGKVLEDKVLKRIEPLELNIPNNYKNISFNNKIKLGFRNTFNIVPKFVLLLLVYFFIVVALMSEYSSFKKEEYEASKSGYNYIFQDLNDKRIILKKNDKTFFTDDDINKINKINNVDYILQNDILADEFIQLTTASHELYIGGQLSSINLFKKKVDIGRLPENDNEIVILGSKDDYYLGNKYKAILESEFYLTNEQNNSIDTTTPLKVVGIKYLPKDDYSDFTIYFSDKLLEKMLFNVHQDYSDITVNFMGKNYASSQNDNNFQIKINNNVPPQKAYISEDYNIYCDKENCLQKSLTINVNNLYYNDSKQLTIAKTYNKNNIKTLLTLDNYNSEDFNDNYNGIIYINPEDYNSLFNKPTYQMSVYIKNIEAIDETIKKLNDSGYNTLAIKDTLVTTGIVEAMNIFKTITTIVLVITLFFIAYFIIRIILKSRNVYFSTIRMLGADKKVAKQLLIIELLIISNIAFLIFVIMTYLNKLKFFKIQFLDTINTYFHYKDYLILYLIVTIMSYLISQKYASKLFKDTIINTYKEEV